MICSIFNVKDKETKKGFSCCLSSIREEIKTKTEKQELREKTRRHDKESINGNRNTRIKKSSYHKNSSFRDKKRCFGLRAGRDRWEEDKFSNTPFSPIHEL
jgi:hypothetical protein